MNDCLPTITGIRHASIYICISFWKDLHIQVGLQGIVFRKPSYPIPSRVYIYIYKEWCLKESNTNLFASPIITIYNICIFNLNFLYQCISYNLNIYIYLYVLIKNVYIYIYIIYIHIYKSVFIQSQCGLYIYANTYYIASHSYLSFALISKKIMRCRTIRTCASLLTAKNINRNGYVWFPLRNQVTWKNSFI